MAFVNEYIPEADYEKYDLRRVCGEHNLKSLRGRMYARTWTIDRERDAFLIQVWSHHEAEFDGWAFYWKGEWMFLEMAGMGGGGLQPDGSCWYGYRIRKFSLPERLQALRDEVVADLTQAFGDYCGGGVFSSYKHGTATLEFIQGEAQ
jgi:hypothetical protein